VEKCNNHDPASDFAAHNGHSVEKGGMSPVLICGFLFLSRLALGAMDSDWRKVTGNGYFYETHG
jgi:hypothetical protein